MVWAVACSESPNRTSVRREVQFGARLIDRETLCAKDSRVAETPFRSFSRAHAEVCPITRPAPRVAIVDQPEHAPRTLCSMLQTRVRGDLDKTLSPRFQHEKSRVVRSPQRRARLGIQPSSTAPRHDAAFCDSSIGARAQTLDRDRAPPREASKVAPRAPWPAFGPWSSRYARQALGLNHFRGATHNLLARYGAGKRACIA